MVYREVWPTAICSALASLLPGLQKPRKDLGLSAKKMTYCKSEEAPILKMVHSAEVSATADMEPGEQYMPDVIG